MEKPSVFVGSSSEGLEVARAIRVNLSDDARVTLWNEGPFRPMHGYLESLVNALDQFDFAVLVATADDLTTQRQEATLTPRDNVLFELGLFLGRLGRERTFLVSSTNPSPRLPSDLAGVTGLTFDAKWATTDARPALGGACDEMRRAFSFDRAANPRSTELLAREVSDVAQSSRDMQVALSAVASSRMTEIDWMINGPNRRSLSPAQRSALEKDLTTLTSVMPRLRAPAV